MEVNDWPNGMEVVGENTTKAFMANKFTITMVIYQYWVHFFKELECAKTLLKNLCLFFNEHEL